MFSNRPKQQASVLCFCKGKTQIYPYSWPVCNKIFVRGFIVGKTCLYLPAFSESPCHNWRYSTSLSSLCRGITSTSVSKVTINYRSFQKALQSQSQKSSWVLVCVITEVLLQPQPTDKNSKRFSDFGLLRAIQSRRRGLLFQQQFRAFHSYSLHTTAPFPLTLNRGLVLYSNKSPKLPGQ